MAEEQTQEPVTRDWLTVLQEHWGLAISIAYVYTSYTGMVISYFHFQNFGINVFEFAELNDFLLAAFRQPKSLVVTMFFIAYVWAVFYFLPKYLAKVVARPSSLPKSFRLVRIPNLTPLLSRRYRRLWKSIFVAMLVGTPYFANKNSPNSNEFQEAEISIRGIKNNADDAQQYNKFCLIGTTEKYVFFVERDDSKNVLIAPVTSIQLIRLLDSKPTCKSS